MVDKFGLDQVLYCDEDDQMKKMTKAAADTVADKATNAAVKLGAKGIAKLTTKKRTGILGGIRTKWAEKRAAKKIEKAVSPYKGAAKAIISSKVEKELSD